jgi:hypothetical protein
VIVGLELKLVELVLMKANIGMRDGGGGSDGARDE